VTRKATIKDIARLVGVTPTTVSNVLNGTNRFGDDTRQRVMAVAEELNYTPNMSARALVKKRTYTIGLFIPASPRAFLDAYFSELLRGLTEVSLKHGYVVSIIYSDGLREGVRDRLDGLILTEIKLHDPYIDYFRAIGMPFVALGKGNEHEAADHVISDTSKALKETVNYLYRIGHRRIGYALGPLVYEYVYERYKLFREMQRALGLDYCVRHIATGANSREGGAMAARRIVRNRSDNPTAIIASTDIMALGVIEYLQSVGYGVPQDLSVVGFDDADFSKYVHPSITTVRHDIYRAGCEAAAMLIAKLEGLNYAGRVSLPVKFIVRESTASPQSIEV